MRTKPTNMNEKHVIFVMIEYVGVRGNTKYFVGRADVRILGEEKRILQENIQPVLEANSTVIIWNSRFFFDVVYL